MANIYETAPTTDRDAEQLSRAFGYVSLRDLVDDLPANANVLDVGAGASNLGARVLELRPDVDWTNMDLVYNDERFLEKIKKQNGDAVRYEATDICKLEVKEPEYDRVFTWATLPHIELESRTAALKALTAMAKLTKPTGDLVLGIGFKTSYKDQRPASLRIRPQDLAKAKIANQVLDTIRLKRLNRHTTKIANKHSQTYFGRKDRFKRVSNKGMPSYIWDPKSQEFVYLLSPKGAVVSIGFAHHIAKNMLKRR